MCVALTCLQGKQVNQHNPAILGEILRIFIPRQVQSEEVKQAYDKFRGKRKYERKKRRIGSSSPCLSFVLATQGTSSQANRLGKTSTIATETDRMNFDLRNKPTQSLTHPRTHVQRL